MIGNDVIDLALARKESNWKRVGFLDKIFTVKEQFLIQQAEDPGMMVWNLWSRKEAAYKIYNRETGIRAFIPIQLECIYENINMGLVQCNGRVYFTKTNVSKDQIHTIAVVEKKLFKQLKSINSVTTILKKEGIPFVFCNKTNQINPVSISHHGRYRKAIMLN